MRKRKLKGNGEDETVRAAEEEDNGFRRKLLKKKEVIWHMFVK